MEPRASCSGAIVATTRCGLRRSPLRATTQSCRGQVLVVLEGEGLVNDAHRADHVSLRNRLRIATGVVFGCARQPASSS